MLARAQRHALAFGGGLARVGFLCCYSVFVNVGTLVVLT